MTKEEYEEKLGKLVERKKINTQESIDLDNELVTLRREFFSPTLDELTGKTETSNAFTYLAPDVVQGSVKRD